MERIERPNRFDGKRSTRTLEDLGRHPLQKPTCRDLGEMDTDLGEIAGNELPTVVRAQKRAVDFGERQLGNDHPPSGGEKVRDRLSTRFTQEVGEDRARFGIEASVQRSPRVQANSSSELPYASRGFLAKP